MKLGLILMLDPTPSCDPALYQIDGEHLCTLAQLLEANAETFTQADIESIKNLPPGKEIVFGGGGAAETVIHRVM